MSSSKSEKEFSPRVEAREINNYKNMINKNTSRKLNFSGSRSQSATDNNVNLEMNDLRESFVYGGNRLPKIDEKSFEDSLTLDNNNAERLSSTSSDPHMGAYQGNILKDITASPYNVNMGQKRKDSNEELMDAIKSIRI